MRNRPRGALALKRKESAIRQPGHRELVKVERPVINGDTSNFLVTDRHGRVCEYVAVGSTQGKRIVAAMEESLKKFFWGYRNHKGEFIVDVDAPCRMGW